MNEELNISPKGYMIILFIVGLLIGGSLTSWYESKRDYRAPETIANELEKMLFNSSYSDSVFAHHFADRLLLNDKTTIGQLKHYYTLYGTQSRGLLESQISLLCYKKEWK